MEYMNSVTINTPKSSTEFRIFSCETGEGPPKQQDCPPAGMQYMNTKTGEVYPVATNEQGSYYIRDSKCYEDVSYTSETLEQSNKGTKGIDMSYTRKQMIQDTQILQDNIKTAGTGTMLTRPSLWTVNGQAIIDTITEIHFVPAFDTENITYEEITETPVCADGSANAYVVDTTKLYICSNGSARFQIPSSRGLFAKFQYVTTITGLDMIDVSTCTCLNQAFVQCRALRHLDLSTWDISNVETIAGMFAECDNLESVVFGPYEFESLTDDVDPYTTNISTCMNNVFAVCYNLKKVDFGGGIHQVSSTMFQGSWGSCTALEEVIGLEPVTYIDAQAFKNCTSLRRVDVGPNLETIYSQAFYNCTSLESISFGDLAVAVENDAFYMCTGLKEVHITSLHAWLNTDFVTHTNHPLYYAGNLYLNNQLLLGSIQIPDDINQIPCYSFYNCRNITNITGTNINRIGSGAFERCTNLTTFKSTQLTVIDEYAFLGCSKLSELYTGGNNIMSIGERAFALVTNLQHTDISIDESTSLGVRCFYQSNIEDVLLQPLASTGGSNSTRSSRWEGDTLTSKVGTGVPILLQTHHPENQKNYPDMPLLYTSEKPHPITGDTTTPRVLSMAEGGCVPFALYHLYNCMCYGNGQSNLVPFDNFEQFWNAVYGSEDFITTEHSGEEYLSKIFAGFANYTGWTQHSMPTGDTSTRYDLITNIAEKLSRNVPIQASVYSSRLTGRHSVVIVGVTADGKLSILDSNQNSRNADIYHIWYEDLVDKSGIRCYYYE